MAKTLFGPGAWLAVGVDGADAVVVGDADGEVGVVEGGAGEVVAADVLPVVQAFPPGVQFVALCAGDFGPAQVDGADCGIGLQGGGGERGRGRILLGGGGVGVQYDGGDGQENRRKDCTGSLRRKSHCHAPVAERW